MTAEYTLKRCFKFSTITLVLLTLATPFFFTSVGKRGALSDYCPRPRFLCEELSSSCPRPSPCAAARRVRSE